jgi:hypothetical protein
MRLLLSVLFLIVLVAGCKKDKTPTPEPAPAPTKWELIPGQYKVYDTIGNYLYDMSILHWTALTQEGYRRDTFLFEQFDGQFNIKSYQPEVNPSNYPKYYFYLGSHQPIYDSNNDRWQFFGYDAHYSNDSIYFEYKLENILYYIQDARPYEYRKEKRIGIKQP